MADIQTQLPVRLTDGTNTAGITAGSAVKVDGSSVTQPVSGTITNVPSGTQTVAGTVTLSSQTVTLSSQVVTLSSQTVTTNADMSVGAGTAPSKALLGGMQYNSTAPTLTTGQTVAFQSDVNGNLKIAGSLTSVPSGTQPVSGTVTNVPSGTQSVTGTVTLSSQTVTLSSQTVTVGNSPTVTIGATSVTQPVSGTITNVPSGTQTVAGTVTNVPSGTQTVTGTVTAVASGTTATNADANVGAGTAPSKALLQAVVYNSTAPTLTTGQTVAAQSDINGNMKVVLSGTNTITSVPSGTQAVSGTVTNVPSGTQTVAGTVTNVPSGTQTVTGTVTLSSQTVTLSSQTVTVGNSPTVTIGASTITQAVSGTVTNVPSGTQTVAGTVTNVPSGTQTVAGTVTTSNLVSTGIVNSYATSSALANGSTATLTYTVTVGKTLYLKGVFASSSGAPCKVIVDYGAGPTVAAVGFYSTSSPFLSIQFAQPISIAASTVVNVKIQNNAGAAQDVYATIMGQEV